MARICIITPGQPSTNPRALKEADAIAQTGHEVRMICSYWAAWATGFDEKLQRESGWTFEYAGGRPGSNALRYYRTRLRYGGARRLLRWFPHSQSIQVLSLGRTVTELRKAAESYVADLYIAHYPGALPAAVAAAERHNARFGYDAEDFYSAPSEAGPDELQSAVEACERRYLPLCSYVTAASPGIRAAYATKYSECLHSDPAVILNVFPLAQRPEHFRPTESEGPLRLYWFSQTIGRTRGLEDIVRAMGAVRNLPIELHLRGVWQPGYKEELGYTAQQAGVPPERIISHEPAEPTEMVRKAAEYDAGLAVEPASGINANLTVSNKLFTYLLAGNAILATATDGQKAVFDLLRNGGLCFHPGDTGDVAKTLKLWFQNRDTLDVVRRSNWESGARLFNWDVEKVKFLDLIDNALSTGNIGEGNHLHAIVS